MSKITVRADEDLVERLDALDASKSQVVREALRAYLDGDVGDGAEAPHGARGGGADDAAGADGSLDALIAERVDELVEERLDEAFAAGRARPQPRDVNVNVTVDGAVSDEEAVASDAADEGEAVDPSGAGDREAAGGTSCAQCGNELGGDHVYCPNCGEKATRRAFCECGDEVRSDWAFCPGCGRRTPAADVLDSG